MSTHTNGPGLKILSKAKWYGGGYCSICGHRGDGLIPQQVRFWDPDDGWKVGILCTYCGEEIADRGPKLDDYAVVTKKQGNAEFIDVLAAFGDEDDTYTSGNEL